jgi:hypothetical protein
MLFNKKKNNETKRLLSLCKFFCKKKILLILEQNQILNIESLILNLEYGTLNMESQPRTSNLETLISNLESRTSNLEPPIVNLKSRTSNLKFQNSNLEATKSFFLELFFFLQIFIKNRLMNRLRTPGLHFLFQFAFLS